MVIGRPSFRWMVVRSCFIPFRLLPFTQPGEARSICYI